MGYYIPEKNFEQMISRIELMAISYLFYEDLPFAHVFRWGTHLYMSLFPSVCPSVCPLVAHHISGTVHHLIVIFGTHM